MSPDFTEHVTDTVVHPVAYSDHCGYLCRVMLPNLPRRRRNNIWKLNCSLLHEDRLTAKFTALWEKLLQFKDDTVSTIEWWVSTAKPAIRTFLMNYSREAARWHRSKFQFYQACLRDLAHRGTDQPALLKDFKQFKARLLSDMRRQGAGPVIRSQPVGAIAKEPL